MNIWRLFGFAVWFLILMGIFTAAYAKPIAVASGNGDTITLHDDPCPLKGWKLSVYRYASGKEVKGCWNPAGDMVLTIWEDGDVLPIPPRAFKPVTSL